MPETLQDRFDHAEILLATAARLLASVQPLGGYPRLKCYWCHEALDGATHSEDCPYDGWLKSKGTL